MTYDESLVKVFFNIGSLQGRYDIDVSAHRSAGRSATDLKKMELIYAAISDVGQDLAAKKAAIRKRL